MMIAKRTSINKVVCERLFARGIPEITYAVLANEGAEISEASFVKLIGECGNDPKLSPLVAGRKDLPEEMRPFLDAYMPKGKAQAPRLIKRAVRFCARPLRARASDPTNRSNR